MTPTRPAIDEVVISTDSHTLHDDFGREVVGRHTHRLLGGDWKLQLCANKLRAKERAMSIVKLSTAWARPKSATLMIDGSSFVRAMFCEMEQVSDSGVGERIQPRQGTSGLRSRWVMPFSWTYLQACHV